MFVTVIFPAVTVGAANCLTKHASNLAKRLYAGGIVGRDRDYCNSCRSFVAGDFAGQGEGSTDPMRE